MHGLAQNADWFSMNDPQRPQARSDSTKPLPDVSQLSMTEIIRWQGLLQQELTRRFERQLVLVFSDIVGSTPYFARFGDAAGRQLQQLHFDLLQQGISPHGGRVVDTAGDGAFIVFEQAAAAVQGVVAVQRAVSLANLGRSRPHQLQLRMGLHWGSVLTDGAAVSGDSVNLCARVASSSEVGEIRLTREVFHELGSAARVLCQPVSGVELKGVTRAVEVLRLEWRDRSQFPTQLQLEATGEIIDLPAQDIISFGRLREHEGLPANDVVLAHPDPQLARHISRWHFELRRGPQGYCLRSLSDTVTEVNGISAPKGQDLPVKPGARIQLAGALGLVLLPPTTPTNDDDGRTMIDMAPLPPTQRTP
jgi:class 3 adenylate cyclase